MPQPLSPATGAPATSVPPRLQARGLEYAYHSGLPRPVPALRGVDLDAGAGRLVGLAGPSGSGKTTLAQHLNALLRPARGQVLLDGEDIWRDGQGRTARRRVGLVFQFPEAQLFAETVADDVAFGPRNHGLDRATAERRSAVALDSVGLPMATFGNRSPLSLSGGERRRAAIAGVLAISPSVLVLDEPTAGLDAGNAGLVRDLLLQSCRQGRSVVLISHDMDLMAQLADGLAFLDEGRVRWQGDTRQVLERVASTAAATLELPAGLRLTLALRRLGWSAPALLTRSEACRFATQLRPRGWAADPALGAGRRPGGGGVS